ncbi:MAG: carboxyl transferase domain-containing protein [Pseudomonadota bacterium]|nr:carboxyl transferase domain-containing protein [Pseudomonadota bacterium]
MNIIKTSINTSSDEFMSNYKFNKKMVEDFRFRQEKSRSKRNVKDIKRVKSQGKMLPRERISLLLDKGSPFLELSSLAACEAYEGQAPLASCIVGIGIIKGKHILIIANDPTVKGGAWFPLTVKKIVRALDIAIENHLPVVHLCDSAGGFLPLQAELFADKEHAGRMFRNQCILSKLGIKQLAIVFGHCTAGGAYVPALSDYSIIVKGTGAVFLAGPPLVKAATGENVTAEELGGAELHTQKSGTCDYAAENEHHAVEIGREIVECWTDNPLSIKPKTNVKDPYYPTSELYGIIPNDIKKGYDSREILARIVDGSGFHEFQPDYGKTLICGYAYIWGYKVGILANNGVLFNESALKGAHFIQLCDRNITPILFLQNITGFMVGKEYERQGITKDGAKFLMAQVGCSVPKITLMCNGSFGAGNYAMCGRAFDSRFIFSWPNHQIGIMGGEQAAKTLVEVKERQLKKANKSIKQKDLDLIYQNTLTGFKEQMSAYHATSQLWDDGIIDPLDTRSCLGMVLTVISKSKFKDIGYGVMRF